MAFDNVCKSLAEQYPASFARWLLGVDLPEIQVLKTELSLEPIRADALMLQTPNQLLHLEFQTTPESNPPLPLRMLDYWVRLHRQYRCAIVQIVLFLKPTDSEAAQIDQFQSETTQHRYRVIRLWEQDPAPLLADPMLLPLAVLANTNSPPQLLEQVAKEIARVESTDQQQALSSYAQLLAGLKFGKTMIQQAFRSSVMRESVIYQEIYQEGRQEGRQEGEAALVLRLLNRRFGAIAPEALAQIQTLTIEELEDLAEAILEFAAPEDLLTWLQIQPTSK